LGVIVFVILMIVQSKVYLTNHVFGSNFQPLPPLIEEMKNRD